MLDRDRTHYLKNVMRLGPDDAVAAFNGRDGEWLGRIETTGKRSIALRVERLLAPQPGSIDLWLLFAPLKRGPGDMTVVKAVELGASALVPVMTARTTASRVKQERMRALAIEAAEQCGRSDVPETREPVPLPELLDDWPAERRLVFCDESGRGLPHRRFSDRGPGQRNRKPVGRAHRTGGRLYRGRARVAAATALRRPRGSGTETPACRDGGDSGFGLLAGGNRRLAPPRRRSRACGGRGGIGRRKEWQHLPQARAPPSRIGAS